MPIGVHADMLADVPGEGESHALTENFRKLSANARAVISDSIDRTVKVI